MSIEQTKRGLWCGLCLVLLACQGGATDSPSMHEDTAEEADADAAAPPAAGSGAQHGKPDAGAPSAEPSASGASEKPTKTGAGDEPATQAQRFFLPTPEPENTKLPRVMFDAAGGMHALYPAYGGGGAYYTYCAQPCSDPKAMQVVTLPTDGVVGEAALALTPDGKPRVLLPTYLRVYFAQCDSSCGDEANWHIGSIVEHQAERDVTGQALALDSKGRPRFVMHTYLAYLGVGQLEPHTYYAQCDAKDCTQAANWHTDVIQDQIWYRSNLRFDARDHAHLTTVAIDLDQGVRQVAYLECAQGCTTEADWHGIGLIPAFQSDVERVRYSLAMALTKAGGVRIIALGAREGGRGLYYFECDEQCDDDHWRGSLLSDLSQLGSGVDIALDAHDHPRFVFTLDDNIGLYSCAKDDCTTDDAPWELTKVEFAGELPKDDIILWPNCTIDAWILHDPALALGPDGSPRVAYQATDLSGGVTVVDPTQPRCVAGEDMTLTRMAVMPAIP